MRLIRNFKKRGGRLVSISDSVTGLSSKATWEGRAKDFWVKAVYSEGYPSLHEFEEMHLLEDGDPKPEPREGWAYALGWFG